MVTCVSRQEQVILGQSCARGGTRYVLCHGYGRRMVTQSGNLGFDRGRPVRELQEGWCEELGKGVVVMG